MLFQASDALDIIALSKESTTKEDERIIPVGGSFGLYVAKALNDLFGRNKLGLPDKKKMESLGKDLGDDEDVYTYSLVRHDLINALGDRKEISLSIETNKHVEPSVRLYDIGEEIVYQSLNNQDSIIVAEDYSKLNENISVKLKELLEEGYLVNLILIVDNKSLLTDVEFSCKGLYDLLDQYPNFHLYASYLLTEKH